MSNSRQSKKSKDIQRAKAKERFENETAPVCKEPGCDKVLTPMEYLYNDYCFKHAQTNKAYEKPTN